MFKCRRTAGGTLFPLIAVWQSGSSTTSSSSPCSSQEHGQQLSPCTPARSVHRLLFHHCCRDLNAWWFIYHTHQMAKIPYEQQGAHQQSPSRFVNEGYPLLPLLPDFHDRFQLATWPALVSLFWGGLTQCGSTWKLSFDSVPRKTEGRNVPITCQTSGLWRWWV